MNSSRNEFWRNVLAGLSIAGVLLPESVAYASIAGVPTIHALIAAWVGLCLYPVFGSSRFAIVSPTSSAAAVFATMLAVGGADMGYALVFLTGALFLLGRYFQAGFLGAYISRPALRGFAWGLAVTIIIKQLPSVVGVSVGGSSALEMLAALWSKTTQMHVLSIQIGVASLLLWHILKHSVGRRAFVPLSLMVLALAIGLSFVLGLGAHGVALVGVLDAGGLSLHLPDIRFDQWLRAAELAPALLLILFAESWGSARSLALQAGDAVDANREMMALGAANLASGLLQGLPVGAGFSAAAANQASGGRSKLAGIMAAVALSLLVWQAQSWLAILPLPALAAVVIAILSRDLWPRAPISSLRLGSDAWHAVAAAIGVLAFGVLFGMLLAVATSLLLAVRRFARPLVSELGELPGTRDFVDCVRHPEALRMPGVLIVRPEEPLFFANAERIFEGVRRHANQSRPHTVVLSLEVCDDLDDTSTEALIELNAALLKQHITLRLARVKDRVRDSLSRAGLASPLDGLMPVYWSVDDAVQAAGKG